LRIPVSLSLAFSFLYLGLLFIISLFCFFNLLTVQIGLWVYLFALLVLTALYGSSFRLQNNFFLHYFYSVLVLGILCKILFSFSLPLWEDDWARYLWEGNLLSLGISPFQYPPEYFFTHPLPNLTSSSQFSASEILSRINHPDWTTIYFPLIEIYFFICAKIAPFSLITVKLGYLVFDLGVMFLIKSLRGAKWALLYFLFPIAIKEININAHFEIIPIFFLTLAVWCSEKKYLKLSSFALGLGIHAKLFLIILLPFAIFRNSVNIPTVMGSLKNLFVTFLCLATGFITPFITLEILVPENGSLNLERIFDFGKDFEFNSLIFHLFRYGLNAHLARILSIFILIGFLLSTLLKYNIIFRRKKRSIHWMFFSLFLYLLLTPIANPWYFLILTPFLFLGLRKTHYLWTIILIPQIAYLTYTNLPFLEKSQTLTGFYNLPEAVILFEMFCILIVLSRYFGFVSNFTLKRMLIKYSKASS
jgi:hypothetical protein